VRARRRAPETLWGTCGHIEPSAVGCDGRPKLVIELLAKHARPREVTAGAPLPPRLWVDRITVAGDLCFIVLTQHVRHLLACLVREAVGTAVDHVRFAITDLRLRRPGVPVTGGG